MHLLITLISAALLTATLLGLAYTIVAIAVTAAFARRPLRERPDGPGIALLKPVCGVHEGLEADLASCCDQAYPNFEVRFCVHDARDPAVETIERVRRSFREVSTQLLIGNDATQRNPKIANLVKAEAGLERAIVVIADGDIRVGRDYLAALAAAFDEPATGATTCLYRARPAPGPIGQLGAAYIEEQFAPSVLVAATLGTLRFCLGATMAVRRPVLAGIGGLRTLGPYLADDHELGERVSATGARVTLCRYVVETAVTETNLHALWSHELRWARTSMTQAPLGYAFSFVMFAFPLAVAYALVGANPALGCGLVAAALAGRWMLGAVARHALGVERRTPFWLAPLRDCLSLALWCASVGGRAVRWRGDELTIREGGTIG